MVNVNVINAAVYYIISHRVDACAGGNGSIANDDIDSGDETTGDGTASENNDSDKDCSDDTNSKVETDSDNVDKRSHHLT